jgi:hypothetical protein
MNKLYQPSSHSQVSGNSACLDDSGPYRELNRQNKFFKRYWHVMALGPFTVTVFIEIRFFGDSTSRLAEIPVFVSVAWAMLVAVYGLILTTRVLSIRCPRCKWRFGLGDKCSSCDLPRHAVTYQESELS